MRFYHACCVVLVLFSGAAPAAELEGRIVQDLWNAAYLEGARAGYIHTSVREIERDGQRFYRVTTKLNLAIKRNGATIQLRMDTGNEETPQGKVTGVWMRQYQGEQEQLVLTGTVREGKLEVAVEGKSRQEKKVPWDERAIGLYRQERLFQESKVQPGNRFPFFSYEPTINRVVENWVTVKDFEEVEVFKARKRLLRVETLPLSWVRWSFIAARRNRPSARPTTRPTSGQARSSLSIVLSTGPTRPGLRCTVSR
jgi:hypothetical protein